jgi:hypothetical protein
LTADAELTVNDPQFRRCTFSRPRWEKVEASRPADVDECVGHIRAAGGACDLSGPQHRPPPAPRNASPPAISEVSSKTATAGRLGVRSCRGTAIPRAVREGFRDRQRLLSGKTTETSWKSS